MVEYVDGVAYRDRVFVEDLGGVYSMPGIHAHLLGLPWLTVRAARHEYFMSLEPRTYSYGNRMGAIEYASNPFTDDVLRMMRQINADMGTRLNVCFLNKYDNEQQHLGWHADDFPGMDATQPIAVVSFGAERDIWVKPQWQKGEVPQNQRYKLGDGSLFVMSPGYQDTHFHRIPKHDRQCGWRISLTFRSFN